MQALQNVTLCFLHRAINTNLSFYAFVYYIVTNSQVLFHNGSLLHSKFNTQPLITVHNSSRILTQYDRFSNYSEYVYCLLASALVL
jgi:hypothetical protein